MRNRERLTEKLVRAAEPRSKAWQIFDSDVLGLSICIYPSGGRSFMFDYRAAGRQRRLTIGRWPEWNVTAARERAKEVAAKPERIRNERRVSPRQRIAQAESEIERINGIIAKIDTALALPDIFTRDPKQAAQLTKARAGAEAALQRAEEEWLEASAELDEAAN